MAVEKTMEKIVSLAKARGFVYPGSEIYGGLANTWDYGPLGVELKNNVKKAWWKKFIQESKYNVGVDCAILMNPQTWVASGHVGGFSDPLMDCKDCHERFRADKIIEEYLDTHGHMGEVADGWSNEKMLNFIKDNNIACPSCGGHNFTDIRQFNLMFKTFQGVTEDSKNVVYLRPETAQGIFVNFKNVQRTTRKKIPFGIGQIGKSFRNEITPGNFTFRTREFEQMELEFFCEPDTDLEWFAYWKEFCINWLQTLGIKPDEMRVRDHEAEELSFYSKATSDIEFLFPFGWGELWGIADRTNYDLSRIWKFPVKISHTLMKQRKKNTSHTLLSHLWVLTELSLHSSAVHMMKRILAQKRNLICVQSFISIRHWHLLRLVYCHYPRNWVRKQKLSILSFPRTGTANMMTEAILVKDTEDRMKSVLRSV